MSMYMSKINTLLSLTLLVTLSVHADVNCFKSGTEFAEGTLLNNAICVDGEWQPIDVPLEVDNKVKDETDHPSPAIPVSDNIDAIAETYPWPQHIPVNEGDDP